MPTFSIQLKGSDDRNQLVKWIWAPDLATLDLFLDKYNLRRLVQGEPLNLGPQSEEYTEEDGLEISLNEQGEPTNTPWTSRVCWKWWDRQIAVVTKPEKNLYKGIAGQSEWFTVLLNGEPFDHKPSLEVENHSPDGLSWGYIGSGPSQLALAILLHETGDVALSVKFYHNFMRRKIALWERNESWKLTSAEVKRFLMDAQMVHAS